MADQTLTKDARELSDGLITYLKKNGKVASVVPKVQKLLTRVSAQAKKDHTAVVETSVALSTAEKEAIRDALRKVLNHDVSIDNVVAPELIGGLRIQVGDWVVDTTVAHQLSQLAGRLTTQY
jgi:ATP synthase F1 delta subunit